MQYESIDNKEEKPKLQQQSYKTKPQRKAADRRSDATMQVRSNQAGNAEQKTRICEITAAKTTHAQQGKNENIVPVHIHVLGPALVQGNCRDRDGASTRTRTGLGIGTAPKPSSTNRDPHTHPC